MPVLIFNIIQALIQRFVPNSHASAKPMCCGTPCNTLMYILAAESLTLHPYTMSLETNTETPEHQTLYSEPRKVGTWV